VVCFEVVICESSERDDKPQDEKKIGREGYKIVKAVRQIRKEDMVTIKASFRLYKR
jgi:hypothetical protein